MWKTEPLGEILKITVVRNDQPLAFRDVLESWRDDDAFRAGFIALLAATPFNACFWEARPVTEETADQPFECALIAAPELARRAPDPQSFDSHFSSAGENDSTVTFANLGGDAMLVVPTPQTRHSAYPHLAAFARHAPEPQQHALWQTVASTLIARLDQRPIWLSTAGQGVAWLHIRLDARPKYYNYAPYKPPPSVSSAQ